MTIESLQFIHLQVTNEVGSSLEGNTLQNQMWRLQATVYQAHATSLHHVPIAWRMKLRKEVAEVGKLKQVNMP